MGPFIKNHGNYQFKETGYTQYMYRADSTGYMINMGVNNIFGMLTSIVPDGRGGVDKHNNDEQGLSKKDKNQIDELTKNINLILKDAGVSSVSELNNSIETSKENINAISGTIEQTKLKISDNQAIIDGYQAKYDDLQKQLSSADDTNKISINKQIEQLNKEKSNAEAEINRLQKELEKQENDLKTEQSKCSVLMSQLAQIENYQYQIDKLENKDLPDEVKYDVEKETNDLTNFTTALKAFKESPNITSAKNLYDTYHSGNNGVENATARRAYDYIVKQYPQLFDKLELAKK